MVKEDEEGGALKEQRRKMREEVDHVMTRVLSFASERFVKMQPFSVAYALVAAGVVLARRHDPENAAAVVNEAVHFGHALVAKHEAEAAKKGPMQ
jgi:hypothetical protein